MIDTFVFGTFITLLSKFYCTPITPPHALVAYDVLIIIRFIYSKQKQIN